MTIREITDYLNGLYPPEIADEDDKVKIGLQVGSLDSECSGVALCLDCTKDVLEQAKESGCNLVLSHHPLIFHPMQEICTDEGKGRAVAFALKNDVTVFSMHTNLDKASGGINDYLATKVFGAKLLSNDGCLFTARFEDGKSRTLSSFAALVSEKLGDKSVKVVGDPNGVVKTFAMCSGGGSCLYDKAKESGADVFLTGDIPHHIYVEAAEDGVCLIEFSHYHSEIVAVDILRAALKSRYQNLRVVNAIQLCPFRTLEEL